jgi:hypothetical protein
MRSAEKMAFSSIASGFARQKAKVSAGSHENISRRMVLKEWCDGSQHKRQ